MGYAYFPNMSKLSSFNANTYLEYSQLVGSYRNGALNCALQQYYKVLWGEG